MKSSLVQRLPIRASNKCGCHIHKNHSYQRRPRQQQQQIHSFLYSMHLSRNDKNTISSIRINHNNNNNNNNNNSHRLQLYSRMTMTTISKNDNDDDTPLLQLVQQNNNDDTSSSSSVGISSSSSTTTTTLVPMETSSSSSSSASSSTDTSSSSSNDSAIVEPTAAEGAAATTEVGMEQDPIPQQQQQQQQEEEEDDDDEKDEDYIVKIKTDDQPIIRSPLLPPLPQQIAQQYNHVTMPPNSDYTTYNPQSLAHHGRILQHLEVLQDDINQNINNNNNTSPFGVDTATTTTTTNVTTSTTTGRNSYLKINFFQRPYLEGLYNVTASIQKRLDIALQEHIDKGNNPRLQKLPNIYFSKRYRKTREFKLKHTIPNTNFRVKPETINEIKEKEKIIVPPLQIIPRPLSSLHCTLFFGGTVLTSHECTDEELLYFYEKINKRLALSGFIHDDGITQFKTHTHLPDDYWFHVKEFKVFPPRGKYLIVAELQASLAYHHLWRDLHDIARNEMSKWSRPTNTTSSSSYDDDDDSNTTTTTANIKSAIQAFMNTPSQKHIQRWIPHITVANIQHAMDGKRVEEKILQKVLKSLSNKHYDNEYAEHIENMKCHSISMGGPIPQLKHQKDHGDPVDNHQSGTDLLNWDYKFQFIRRGAKYDIEWDESIWEERHDPDPFGLIRKKWIRKKNRLIARGIFDPNYENKKDEYDSDDEESEMNNSNNEDDNDDEKDVLYEEHPQHEILQAFRNQSKPDVGPQPPTTAKSRNAK